MKKLTDAARQLAPRVWQACRQDRSLIAAVGALLVLANLASLAAPLLLKASVDHLSGVAPAGAASMLQPLLPVPPGVPVSLVLGCALLFVGATLLSALRDLLATRLSQRTVSSFAQRSFAHLLAPDAPLSHRHSNAALAQQVHSGVAGIGVLLGALLFTALPLLMALAAVLLVLVIGYSVWFSVVVVLSVLTCAALGMVLAQHTPVQQRRAHALDARAQGSLDSSLRDRAALQAVAREEQAQRGFAGDLAAWQADALRQQRLRLLWRVGQALVILGGSACVTLLAAHHIMRGTMTLGDLVLVNAYLLLLCLPLPALGFVWRAVRHALSDVQPLLVLLDEPADPAPALSLTTLAAGAGGLQFEQLRFAHAPGRQVLDDVDLQVLPGQTVAVVGLAGAGKSTLVGLLLRQHVPQSGRVTVAGQDVRSLSASRLRDTIGVALQHTVLFDDTVAGNIGCGRPGADLQAVIAAARAAQLHDFILSLPQRYETVLGPRGMQLSASELQRIGIARAWLTTPPILVFDDATSALDTGTEAAIQAQLGLLRPGRSILITAQRLSSVVHADLIVLLDQGRIVERGRHAALLAQGGLYAELWRAQRQQQQVAQLAHRLARRPVNLARLVGNLVDGLHASRAPQVVPLHSVIDLANARVSVDANALAHALWDLATQALDTALPGGRVTLTLARHGLHARLVLTGAEGAGAQAGSAAQQMAELVVRQGGSFSTEPAWPQAGLRHVIDLPLHALTAEPMPAPPPPAPGMPETQQPALQGFRLVLVEDGQDARESLQAVLQQEGAEVQSFADGQSALQWFGTRPHDHWPDLLVCDIALDDINGHQVIQQLRRLETARAVAHSARMPAVALTGLASDADRQRALAAGFQRHLCKPVRPRELVATLINLNGGAAVRAS